MALSTQDTDVPRAKFLFIAGCGRSGTTALVHLLSQDNRFVIGRERFKYCRSSITPDHFREKRFFFPDEKETNHLVDEFYDRLRTRWRSQDIRCIGDKVPLYYKDLFHLAETFPDCGILFLVRGLEGAAASYNARAENSEDRAWKPSMDYPQAVKDWNESLARLGEFVRAGHRDRVFVIPCERFFAGEESYLEALYEFLDPPGIGGRARSFSDHDEGLGGEKSRRSTLLPDMIEPLSARRGRRLERSCLSLCSDMGRRTVTAEGN